jgi:hypothetical protein
MIKANTGTNGGTYPPNRTSSQTRDQPPDKINTAKEREYSGFVILALSSNIAPSTESGNLTEFARTRELHSLARLLDEFRQVKSTRLITSLPIDEILKLESNAAAKSSNFAPLHSLTSYWRLDCRMLSEEQEIKKLVKLLNQLPEINLAYREMSVSKPMVVNAADDPLSVKQNYLDAAPTGIDARFAWTQPNGDGAGVGFVDLERGWFTKHEDLKAKTPTVIFGDNSDDEDDRNHGTAVLGIVAGVDNTLGVVGIATNCTSVRMVSHYNAATDTSLHVADAITAATAAMPVGDLLLLEVQRSSLLLPTETDPADADAIKLAVANGIIVVEAAGNGTQDLDSWTNSMGQTTLNRSSPQFQDSGAIMVAQSVSTVPHHPSPFSNFGSRIDCYSWGENVTTCGYGDLSPPGTIFNKMYTAKFNGTSSASAIITGAAIILQGILGIRLSPEHMRTLLSNPATGTPQGPSPNHIGFMPDLKKIIRTLLRAQTGAPVALCKQTDNVLTALVVENEGALTVSLVEGTDNWQGPSLISVPKVFPRETHIAMCKQTDDVLTALAVSNEGALNVSFVEGTGLWQGPDKISAPDTFHKGAPVAMCKQTDDTLTALVIDKSGVLNASWVDGTGLWQGPTPIGQPHSFAIDKETHIAMCRQTDDTLTALAVDNEGTLTVSWVDGSGLWQGPKLIGPINKFSRGAPVAMCKQTDDVLTALAVDNQGAMNVMWIEGTGPWQGPNKISPPDFRPEETHVAMCKQTDDTLTALAVDKDGALTMLWVDGTGPWQGPARISDSDVFRPGAHVDMCKQTDNVLTALVVDDAHGSLNVSWVEGTDSWQGPKQIWP